MDMSFKRWELPPLNKDEAALLAEECEIHPFLALMLHLRGIQSAEEAAEYVAGGELADDPYAFADMDAAVERLQRALDSGERMAVYGDYDCDGVTSTVLLYSYLKKNGAWSAIISRNERANATGASLQCGGVGEGGGTPHRHSGQRGGRGRGGRLRRGLGVDVVVTDHHMPPDPMPRAAAVVDPHRPDCGSQYKDYAGWGSLSSWCALWMGTPTRWRRNMGTWWRWGPWLM